MIDHRQNLMRYANGMAFLCGFSIDLGFLFFIVTCCAGKRAGLKMRIKKVYNNNVLLAENDQHIELVVMGRGLAFQKKAGEEVEEAKVEKTFVLEKKDWSQKFQKLLNEIPVHYFEIASDIIQYAESSLNAQLSNYLYLTLTDHMNYAVSRHKQGIDIRNALIWEIRKFYKKEFTVGLKALEIIKCRTGEQLTEDEAGFIALHFVNAQIDGQGMRQTIQMTQMVNDILNIVKYYFKVDLNEKSLNYERFVTHLRFFAQRLFYHEKSHADDDFLYEQVKKKYASAFRCMNRVKEYLRHSLDSEISKDEQVYLTIHIHRVTEREQ